VASSQITFWRRIKDFLYREIIGDEENSAAE
jgi:hypothetical protein